MEGLILSINKTELEVLIRESVKDAISDYDKTRAQKQFKFSGSAILPCPQRLFHVRAH